MKVYAYLTKISTVFLFISYNSYSQTLMICDWVQLLKLHLFYCELIEASGPSEVSIGNKHENRKNKN